jgi:hypothetical protein
MAGAVSFGQNISAGFRHRGRRSDVISLVDGVIKWINAGRRSVLQLRPLQTESRRTRRRPDVNGTQFRLLKTKLGTPITDVSSGGLGVWELSHRPSVSSSCRWSNTSNQECASRAGELVAACSTPQVQLIPVLVGSRRPRWRFW